LTVLGGPEAVARPGQPRKTWQAAHHLIAKDILRFHAVYWPAMLMSADLPMPAGVFCHGYLTVKGQKISKSMPATRVDPQRIAEDMGFEPLRYFVLREYTLGGDGDFTYEALLQRYESDLGNDLGNLLNRTVSMAHRFQGGQVNAYQPADADTLEEVVKIGRSWVTRTAAANWYEFSPAQALEACWRLIREANRYIDAKKPWELAKSAERATAAGPGSLDAVLAICCESLRITARLIAPAMPLTARRILHQLGRPETEADSWPSDDEFAWPGGLMGTPEPLFPRFDPDKKAALIAGWLPPDPTGTGTDAAPAGTATAVGPARPVPPAESDVAGGPPIAKTDFDRVDLRAAKVVACERVPKTDKLLKLTLDIGTEHRTVVSGIAGAYAPEALVGRTVVYLANLKPATIRGVVSHGMILAAGDTDVLALSALDREVPPGTRIR
jgi:methionyl-tRNA synthetase